MSDYRQLSFEELQAGLPHISEAPREEGELRMIVARPATNQRQELEEGQLEVDEGLVGDRWRSRPNRSRQVTVIGTRAIDLIAQTAERRSLSGDQLYVDFDLSEENLPIGAQFAIGEAILQVTDSPHAACEKFIARFGADALKFTNCLAGMRMRLRGVNTKVVQGGKVCVGDAVRKL